MEAINITAYTNDVAQIEAVKAALKTLKIRFEITEQKPYNPTFVAKIKKSRQEHKDGNFVTVEKENFKTFLGID